MLSASSTKYWVTENDAVYDDDYYYYDDDDNDNNSHVYTATNREGSTRVEHGSAKKVAV